MPHRPLRRATDRHTTTPAGVGVVTPVLLGRRAEIDMLRSFCRRIESSGGSLLLTGDRGVGKTALLDVTARWAGAQGYRVLRAQAVRAEAGTEFSTLNQLLLPLQFWMDQLGPGDQQVLSESMGLVESPRRDSRALASAALELLRVAAADDALLMVVDDVQWVDQVSTQVLGLLVGSLDRSRIGLLGASRLHGAGIFDKSSEPRARVQPLDAAAATALVTRHFPELDQRELPDILARGGGNPLALLELPRVMDGGQGVLHKRASMLPLSRRAQHAFAADIRSLPAHTVRMLLLLALEGSGDLTLWGPPAGPSQLRAAERAGLVSVDADLGRLTFSHPLLPFAVIAMATSDERRSAHQELSQLLLSRPGRRAPHLAAATTWPDERVAAELEATASTIARSGDAWASVDLYLRSAALSENLTSKAHRLVRAAHLHVFVTGRISSAEGLLTEAARSAPAVVGSLRYAVAWSAVALRGRGEADTAHDALAAALRAHFADRDRWAPVEAGAPVEAVQLLLDLCLWTQRPAHWSSLRAALAELPREEGIVLRRRLVALIDPTGSSAVGWDQPSADDEQVLAETYGTGLVRLAEPAVQAGRSAAYRDRLEALAADHLDRGGTAVAVDALCCLAQEALLSGDWDRACSLAEQGLICCERQGDQLRSWTLRWVKALVAAGRGDLAAVGRHTDEMLLWADRHGVARVHDYAHHARAWSALGSGDFERAYREATAIAPTEGRPPRGPWTLEAALTLVEAAVHTARDAAIPPAMSEVMQRHDAWPPRTWFLVAAAAAMAAPEPHRADLFERALGQAGSTQYPFELARVRLAYGQLLRRSRATSRARSQLRDAVTIFERLKAQPWVERARIELDATSGTRNLAEPALALTPQERTVALLAASGRTNKQIADRLLLTHRTVAAHLHQVFRKLSVDSRAALRDALDTGDGDPPPDDRAPSRRPLDQGEDRGRRSPASSASLVSP